MTLTRGIRLAPGLYFTQGGRERSCYIIFVDRKAIHAIDAETREIIPNPSECIPIE